LCSIRPSSRIYTNLSAAFNLLEVMTGMIKGAEIMRNQITCTSPVLVTAVVAALAVLTTSASGQSLNEYAKLLASDGSGGDWFGGSVAIDNGIVAAGAPMDDDNNFSGSAYLFDADTGLEQFKLLPLDGSSGDQFGGSVALDSGITAVGSPFDDDNGADSGSVYLFDVATGTQIVKLLPGIGGAGNLFGSSVAIDSGIVAVGAPFDDDNGADSGSVYLFDAGTGTQSFKLVPIDGGAGDLFGSSVAIDSGVVAVGAPIDDDNGVGSGSVYLFDAATGVQIAKLLSVDGEPGDQFGTSVAIGDGVVASGAILDDDNGIDSGSVYLFDAASPFGQIDKLFPDDGAAGDQFGVSTAIGSGALIAGAWSDDENGIGSGSAYYFQLSSGTLIGKMLPTDGASNDSFAGSISIDDSGFIAAGSRLDDDNGPDSGSAYVFDVFCPMDLNGDFALDFFDVMSFLSMFSLGHEYADWNGDGHFNIFDVILYLIDFNSGCLP